MSDIAEFQKSYEAALQHEVADADLPPEIIEQFTVDSLEKRLPEREVYFVTRKSDGKRAVLRVTGMDGAENAAAESAVLNRLDHPSLPKVLGVWEHNGRSFLVREYFSGDDLYTYIRKYGPLSKEQLTAITLRLCDILSYLHAQDPPVIHRDIKPENIILSGGDEVKLIDFGIARNFRRGEECTENDKDTRIAGTKPYMAPEQFGSEQTDNRADLYSLGVVMIYMATGKTDRKKLKSAYPYKGLASIIQKCIRKDRSQRYRTAAQLKRHILWEQQHMTRKLLLTAGALAAIATAFFAGFSLGRTQGFESGVESIMASPVRKNELFSKEELLEPVEFDNWYLDVAVRSIIGKDLGQPIYRIELVNHVWELYIYGTWIEHPALRTGSEFTKTHIDKGLVKYEESVYGTIDERGDISSLADIPNMYYLRSLALTSQNISDLTPLGGMKLERLILCDNYIGNLLPLKDMASLKELDLCENPLRDLTPIRGLLSLTCLDISQTSVTDLSTLSGLSRLETLNLVWCDVTDLRPLAELSSLKEVDVSHAAVTDLRPLVREGEPIMVHCAGLPAETIDAVRGMNIVLVEEEESQGNW